jgi:transcriptional regulator with XRE-family HTH domain
VSRGPAASGAVPGYEDLSGRLREERQALGISLRELARRIGVSASLISQIETGKVRPSVSTLYAIATELGCSIDDLLFGDDVTKAFAAMNQPMAPMALDDHPHIEPVQRADARKVIQLSSGVRWERLTSESVPGIDFLYVVYDPGGASAPADAFQRHPGREWGFVLSGELHVRVAFDEHVLGPGDSITFSSTTPHRLFNPGDEPVHGIWFVLGRQVRNA